MGNRERDQTNTNAYTLPKFDDLRAVRLCFPSHIATGSKCYASLAPLFPLSSLLVCDLVVGAATLQRLSGIFPQQKMRAPASPWALVAAAALLAARTAGQALQVQSAVGPNAPSLGWSGTQNNADGPHFMRLSPDGGTLYMALWESSSYITPPLPTSALGPKIVAIPVSGPGVVPDRVGTPGWPILAGGNPTHACNDGVIDGLGTAAEFGRMGICADPDFSNLYVADFDVRARHFARYLARLLR